jgi:hypothetical protein
VSKKPKPITLEQTAQPGCGDLLEVALFAPQGTNERDFLIGADVRFGTMVVAADDWSKSVEIGLAKATLNLDLTGCAIDPAVQRFGDQKPTSLKTHLERKQVENKTAHLSAKGSIGATAKNASISGAEVGLSLGAGVTQDANLSSTETQVANVREEPVVAMSGNRWRFSAVAQAFMQSRYSGDEALCKVRVNGPTVKVEGRLTFQPKDIVIVDVETSPVFLDKFKKSPNKAAIAKVLLSRHLKEINPLADKGGTASIVGWISNLRGDVKHDD